MQFAQRQRAGLVKAGGSLPSGLVLIQRALHQGFAERKQLNQIISQLANYVPENFNPNWWLSISSDLQDMRIQLLTICLFVMLYCFLTSTSTNY